MKLSIFDCYQRSSLVSLKKIFLILLLSATALNAEKTSLSATDLNTEKVSLSSTALNATKAPLIRDVSWTGYIYYEPGSFYVLLDPIYEDKISLLEEQWGETNFIFSWLLTCSLLKNTLAELIKSSYTCT